MSYHLLFHNPGRPGKRNLTELCRVEGVEGVKTELSDSSFITAPASLRNNAPTGQLLMPLLVRIRSSRRDHFIVSK